MPQIPIEERRAKGINIIDLVKVLKIYRRTHKNAVFSKDVEALFKERILPNKWYSYRIFLELINFAYKNLLASKEDNAVQLGMAGGLVVLKEYHGVFIEEGDPIATLLSLRHSWRSYFNFGFHEAKSDDDHSVEMTVGDYPDVGPCHAHMIIGWDMGGAKLAGASDIRYELLTRPWEGAGQLTYIIRFRV
ncbi:MAG: hypothetical protein JXA30_23075 [Deltaproteobacteria bacterium]|nr:hypothetical protein [Deltaproteobacteria bacterium]